VLRLLQLAIQLHKQAGTRVTTGDLNRAIREAVEKNAPTMHNSKQPKIFYATQIGTHPPTIVLFTNGPELFEETYLALPHEVAARRLYILGSLGQACAAGEGGGEHACRRFRRGYGDGIGGAGRRDSRGAENAGAEKGEAPRRGSAGAEAEAAKEEARIGNMGLVNLV